MSYCDENTWVLVLKLLFHWKIDTHQNHIGRQVWKIVPLKFWKKLLFFILRKKISKFNIFIWYDEKKINSIFSIYCLMKIKFLTSLKLQFQELNCNFKLVKKLIFNLAFFSPVKIQNLVKFTWQKYKTFPSFFTKNYKICWNKTHSLSTYNYNNNNRVHHWWCRKDWKAQPKQQRKYSENTAPPSRNKKEKTKHKSANQQDSGDLKTYVKFFFPPLFSSSGIPSFIKSKEINNLARAKTICDQRPIETPLHNSERFDIEMYPLFANCIYIYIIVNCI